MHRKFPQTRLRRSRLNNWSRDIVRESSFSTDDLIYPIFVTDCPHDQTIESMPGVLRISMNNLLKTCERVCKSGIKLIALFPCIDKEKKKPHWLTRS